MSVVEIRIRLEGEDIVVRRFEAIAERLGDLRPAWPAVRQVFFQLMAQSFASEGASTDFGMWPELAESTKAERARLGFPPAHPILQRTRRLARSLTAVGPEALYADGPTFMIAGSTVEYFPYHQSRLPRRRLPRRPPASFTADQRHALLRPIRVYLTGHDPNAPRRSPRP